MIFILLADQLVPALATINSRCVVVNFVRPDDAEIAAVLISEGIKPDLAASVSHAASGNLGRARHLAADKFLVKRQEAFASIPPRLDGTGAQVAALVDELFEHIDEAAAPLLKAQVDELSTLEERVALTGERGSGRKALQDRHKRQLRKFKTDELRSGLATIAGVYHALIVTQPTPSNSDVYIQAIERIHKAMGALGLNVNEALVLQALFLQCPSLMPMPQVAPVN
jgi:DNA polymerase-3 subunit delta'